MLDALMFVRCIVYKSRTSLCTASLQNQKGCFRQEPNQAKHIL